MSAAPCFFHVDLDAFFASVEQLEHPEYRGNPVIVTGRGQRAVVSTCSYEARKFGVHSAMPKARAEHLCPEGIFIIADMPRYHKKSKAVMAVLAEFSPDVMQVSVDEAFLDMTGMERLFGPPKEAAARLKAAVLENTGLTVSVGVAENKYLAKIASGFQKPDGLTVVEGKDAQDFMLSLPLKDIWGVGKKTLERLNAAGFTTTESVASSSEALLQTILGKAAGHSIFLAVQGQDPGFFSGEAAERSISSEKTLEVDISDYNIVETLLFEFAQELSFRMFDEGVSSDTVSIKIRYFDFSTVTAQSKGERPVNDSADLFARLKVLFAKKCERGKPIRLLGAGLQNIKSKTLPEQEELFESNSEKRRALSEAVYKLNKKMGRGAVSPAKLIDPKKGAEEKKPQKNTAL